MSTTVHVIYRHGAIEDHYSAPVAVALSPEDAATWITRTVEHARRVRNAHEVGKAAVTAWEAANPDPFTEPMPPLGKRNLPSKTDPRYPAARAKLDEARAVYDAWSARKDAAWSARHKLILAVWTVALAPLGLPEAELDVSLQFNSSDPLDEDEFFVEPWETVS